MKKQNKKLKQYRYSLPMEMVGWELYGMQSREHGLASAYSDPAFFRKQSLKFVNKIRKRINNIVTNDELFREHLLFLINSIENKIKLVTRENNEIDIIASLFQIVVNLLGWGHYEGDFIRTPVFYQTEKQKEKFIKLVTRQGVPSEIVYQRRKIIIQLRKVNLTYQQIGLILGITDSCAKQLEKAEHLESCHEEEVKRRENIK